MSLPLSKPGPTSAAGSSRALDLNSPQREPRDYSAIEDAGYEGLGDLLAAAVEKDSDAMEAATGKMVVNMGVAALGVMNPFAGVVAGVAAGFLFTAMGWEEEQPSTEEVVSDMLQEFAQEMREEVQNMIAQQSVSERMIHIRNQMKSTISDQAHTSPWLARPSQKDRDKYHTWLFGQLTRLYHLAITALGDCHVNTLDSPNPTCNDWLHWGGPEISIKYMSMHWAFVAEYVRRFPDDAAVQVPRGMHYYRENHVLKMVQAYKQRRDRFEETPAGYHNRRRAVCRVTFFDHWAGEEWKVEEVCCGGSNVLRQGWVESEEIPGGCDSPDAIKSRPSYTWRKQQFNNLKYSVQAKLAKLEQQATLAYRRQYVDCRFNGAKPIIHYVSTCTECGGSWCNSADFKEDNACVERKFTVGSALSAWGCSRLAKRLSDNAQVANDIVRDSYSGKIYVTEKCHRSKGLIHPVTDCTQCGPDWCAQSAFTYDAVTTDIFCDYQVGVPLSDYGCDRLPSSPTVMHVSQEAGGPGGVYVLSSSSSSVDSQIGACMQKCKSLGYCCNELSHDVPKGSFGYFSCAQACAMRARGATEATCHERCELRPPSWPYNCTYDLDGTSYPVCWSCGDKTSDPKCNFGVADATACQAGCAMDPISLACPRSMGTVHHIPTCNMCEDMGDWCDESRFSANRPNIECDYQVGVHAGLLNCSTIPLNPTVVRDSETGRIFLVM
ncbi:unnamed protein product [Symbiodinium microadriaticum]|nr:unnamed protein product [Symbiodinium microadriaticum]